MNIFLNIYLAGLPVSFAAYLRYSRYCLKYFPTETIIETLIFALLWPGMLVVIGGGKAWDWFVGKMRGRG